MANSAFTFTSRHIGPSANETAKMLQYVGAKTLDELIDQTVPEKIRLKNKLNLPEGLSEYAYLQHLKRLYVPLQMYCLNGW